MKCKWVLSAAIMDIMLVGCGTPIEDQLESSFAASEQAFSADAKKPNSYVLFVNALEDGTSKLSYDRLLSEQEDDIVEMKTFEADELFGYTAILKSSKDAYQIVTAIDGMKLTTISTAKNMDEKIENMMTITKSVQLKQ